MKNVFCTYHSFKKTFLLEIYIYMYNVYLYNVYTWLKGRGYIDKILKARKFSSAELLNNQRKKMKINLFLILCTSSGSIKSHNDQNTPYFNTL